MLDTIITAFYLLLPAYLANMCPVIFGKLGWLTSLAKPIDNGVVLGGQPLFGSSKTWRGLIAGIIGGCVMTFIQAILFGWPFWQHLSLIDYPANWLPLGILGGAGAILGDLLKSFFKRRVGIKSGGVWPVFDQLDFIVGFFLASYWLIRPDWTIIVAACLMTLLLHPLVNIISYLIGWKRVWW